MRAEGCRLQATGYRLQATGYRLQATGYRLRAESLPRRRAADATDFASRIHPLMLARVSRRLVALAAAGLLLGSGTQYAGAQAPGGIQTPEQFFGLRIGADNKLARWDRIVDYMRQLDGASDRVQMREL